MKLDFLIPGSPNNEFYSQIAFFSLCLRALGGEYQRARVVAVFGDTEIRQLPEEWLPFFEQIEIEWADPDEFQKLSYTAQSDRRFELIRDEADIAFLCDADVAPMASFDALLDNLLCSPAIAGVVAHYHFPRSGKEADPESDWNTLSEHILGFRIERPYRYTFHDTNSAASAPFYINYGVVAGTPALLKSFYEKDKIIRPEVEKHLGTWWSPQVSLALSCVALDLPTRPLPMRYNYPNDPWADQRFPEELQNIVFLHYLRVEEFERNRIFTTEEQFDKFLALTLRGSNQRFQEFVRSITKGRYPFKRNEK